MGPMSMSPQQDLPLIELCLEQAVQAADKGFCQITFGEQHFNGYEPYCNPLLMAARLAPFLNGAFFGTTITPITLHHPLRLVEDVNVLDNLTRGKFVLGISAGRPAVGGFSPDMDNFGLDPERRLEIFSSKLDVMLQAWAHEPGDPPIRFDTFWGKGALGGRMMPLSYRAGKPLVAIGTSSDDVVKSTGKRGWPLYLGPCLRAEAVRKLALHREAMVDSGVDTAQRDQSALLSMVTRHSIVGATEDEAWERAERMMGRMAMLRRGDADRRSLREMAAMDLSVPGDPADILRRNAEVVQSWLICGSPAAVVEQFEAYAEVGVKHVNTRFTVGPGQPEDIWRSFDLFTAQVLPHLNPQQFTAPSGNEVRSYAPPPAKFIAD
jgi:alkanesulfonate monooxygenase SsuD/methylene tetrahydromethanopterin reductase-like flavin-dependent oxidoreductase (luciferase family)